MQIWKRIFEFRKSVFKINFSDIVKGEIGGNLKVSLAFDSRKKYTLPAKFYEHRAIVLLSLSLFFLDNPSFFLFLASSVIEKIS